MLWYPRRGSSKIGGSNFPGGLAMRWGICTAVENAAAAKAAGWDFVEENVQGLLQGHLVDGEWKGLDRTRSLAIPVTAANCLVPGSIKITGPTADLAKLEEYMTRVLARAAKAGMKTLVFGSGGARQVPDGTSKETAFEQIVDFAKMSADIAASAGVTIVVEPLNRGECNIVNSVAEGMTYVKAVNHPNLQCLVDSYHFWLEDESLEDLKAAMPWIKHVHLADRDGRVAPGESGAADYRPFFQVLKQGGYGGLISVEALKFTDYSVVAPRVLAFVKKQWNEA
jgi:sugar phosphate isomerase/epimerase